MLVAGVGVNNRNKNQPNLNNTTFTKQLMDHA